MVPEFERNSQFSFCEIVVNKKGKNLPSVAKLAHLVGVSRLSTLKRGSQEATREIFPFWEKTLLGDLASLYERGTGPDHHAEVSPFDRVKRSYPLLFTQDRQERKEVSLSQAQGTPLPVRQRRPPNLPGSPGNHSEENRILTNAFACCGHFLDFSGAADLSPEARLKEFSTQTSCLLHWGFLLRYSFFDFLQLSRENRDSLQARKSRIALSRSEPRSIGLFKGATERWRLDSQVGLRFSCLAHLGSCPMFPSSPRRRDLRVLRTRKR